jgi:hypothetical protein
MMKCVCELLTGSHFRTNNFRKRRLLPGRNNMRESVGSSRRGNRPCKSNRAGTGCRNRWHNPWSGQISPPASGQAHDRTQSRIYTRPHRKGKFPFGTVLLHRAWSSRMGAGHWCTTSSGEHGVVPSSDKAVSALSAPSVRVCRLSRAAEREGMRPNWVATLSSLEILTWC